MFNFFITLIVSVHFIKHHTACPSSGEGNNLLSWVTTFCLFRVRESAAECTHTWVHRGIRNPLQFVKELLLPEK